MTDGAADRRWEALREELEALPQSPVPRTHPRNWVFRFKRGLDFIGHIRRDSARFFAKANPYPKPWQHVEIPAEGVTVAGWYGPPPAGTSDWALLLVPGMFSTKDDTAHKRRALRIWRGWKIPVLAIDMRGFGESTGISTAGWKEAVDVVAAAKWLRNAAGVKRIAVLAESLGGAAALNALALDGESGEDMLAGGVLCFSAFMDARDAVAYISERPPDDHPFAVPWVGFRRLLGMKTMGGYERFDDYLDDAARVHGLSGWEELADLANPKWKIPLMRQPTLLVHAADDPVIPLRHARRMERYAADNRRVQVLTVPWGTHTGFEPMDPWWYWEVLRRFFGAVNNVELANMSDDFERTKSKAAPVPDAPDAAAAKA